MKLQSREFDCMECGRHVVQTIADWNKLPLCAECLYLPGWFQDQALRSMLDPDMTEAAVRAASERRQG